VLDGFGYVLGTDCSDGVEVGDGASNLQDLVEQRPADLTQITLDDPARTLALPSRAPKLSQGHASKLQLFLEHQSCVQGGENTRPCRSTLDPRCPSRTSVTKSKGYRSEKAPR
jgi:hypothetical protein